MRARAAAPLLLVALVAAAYLAWPEGGADAGIQPTARPTPETESPPPILQKPRAVEPPESAGAAELHAERELAGPQPPDAEDEAPLPANGIEVLVLVGDDPAPRGWVHLASGRSYPEDPWNEVVDARHATLDAKGTAFITGLESGDYVVGAQLADGPTHWKRIRYERNAPQRIVFELGTARLFGTVYAPDGQPVPHARVGFSTVRTKISASARSDDAGQYTIDHLPAVVAWISLEAGFRATRLEEMGRIRLEEGEAPRRDFGRPDGLPTWRGVVRNASGDASPNYPRPGHVGKIHFERESDGAYRAQRFEPDGTFAIRLEAGSYTVSVNAASSSYRWPRLEKIVVPESGLDQDVRVLGARVTGTVTRAGNPLAGTHVSLLTSDGTHLAYGVVTDATGRFVLDGVQPGTWKIKSWPHRAHPGPDVVIGADVTEVMRQLVAR